MRLLSTKGFVQGWTVRAALVGFSNPKEVTRACIVASGLDDMRTYDKDVGRQTLQIRSHAMAFQHAISAPERCPFPVIVATHGFALGLAVDIAAACDIRYAASNTTFCIKVSASCYDLSGR